jgi:ribA/ribD-fused uncharacterized protein
MIVFAAPEPSDYEAFSNFEPCVIEMDGITYPTTEHAFQAYKSRNPTIRKHIAGLKTPGQAKRAGRSLPLRNDWQKVKFDIMVECLRLKFEQEPFRTMLLETGDEEIAEDARQWNDAEWGLGKSGKGNNKLGKALMKVRDELRGVTC